jgi:2-amino-4-hydroxy-6-hydroxymethyldihydropteridine diphosphokinase
VQNDFNNGIFLLLGSNENDRLKYLTQAKQQITSTVGDIVKQSAIYETQPWGNFNQQDFLNQVIEISTSLSPEELLDATMKIETELGRVRAERWGPRKIDIDILLYGEIVIHSPRLEIPHPAIPDRRFTLVPFSEIAGDVIHPVNRKTIENLLKECPDEQGVRLYSQNS